MMVTSTFNAPLIAPFLFCLSVLFHSPFSAAAPLPTADENVIFYGVWTDDQCTIPAKPGQGTTDPYPSLNTSIPCLIDTYVDPDGKNQTNANCEFNCENTNVTWRQYPGSPTCNPPPGALNISAVLSTVCSAVQTHFGVTYQKLIKYDVPCSAKHPRLFF